MKPGLLDEIAKEAIERYRLFQRSIEALYARAVVHPDFGKPSFRNEVERISRGEAAGYLAREGRVANNVLMSVAIEARRSLEGRLSNITSADFTDATLTHLSASQQHLLAELEAQVMRDRATLHKRLQTLDLEVSACARSRHIPYRKALIEYHIANPAPKLDLQFRDRGGRVRRADGYVGATWRLTALSVFNEFVLQGLSEAGEAFAAVMKAEDDKEMVVDRVSLIGGNDGLTYSEALERYFHPNSNHYLAAERLDVRA